MSTPPPPIEPDLNPNQTPPNPTPQVRTRYVKVACFASLLQACCSLMGAVCWDYVHEALRNRPANCLAELKAGGVGWFEKDDEALDASSILGPPVCLAEFRAGPAWIGLICSAVVCGFLSIDSLLR